MIENIIDNNATLKSHKKMLIPLIYNIVNTMPKGSLENFLKNLSEVKFYFKDEFKIETSENFVVSTYNPIDKEIYIPYNELQKLKIFSQETKTPDKFYTDQINSILTHEFLHLASTREREGIIYCGLSNLSDQNLMYKGITEAITEYLALFYFPDVPLNYSNYKIEVLIIAQLIELIGKEVVLDSYFNNLGVNLIIEELNNLFSESKNSYKLINLIENIFYKRNTYYIQFDLGQLQKLLIKLLEIKLKTISNKEELVSNFSKNVITSKKLYSLGQNPKRFIGLDNGYYKLRKLEKAYNVK